MELGLKIIDRYPFGKEENPNSSGMQHQWFQYNPKTQFFPSTILRVVNMEVFFERTYCHTSQFQHDDIFV